MPSVPAVSSGEILEVVAMPPASRNDSGPGGGHFEDVLAGATSKGKSSEGTLPAAVSAQPAKSKEPQGETAPAKARGPEKSSPQPKNASADASTSNKKQSAPADSPEGKSAAPAEKTSEGKGPKADLPDEKKDGEAAEKNALQVISQLIAAGVYGLSQLTDGAPVEPDGENGLKLGTLAANAKKQEQAGNGLVLIAPDAGLPQEEAPGAQAAAVTAAEAAAGEAGPQAAANVPAGPAPADDAPEEAILTAVQANAADEAPEAAPQVVVLEGEELSAPVPAEEDAPPAGAPPLPDDEDLTEKPAPVRDVRSGSSTETAAEEVDEEAAVRTLAAAPVQDAEEGAEGARRVDWTRWSDADGDDAAVRTAPAAAAPAVLPGEGDFGQPAQGDDPDGNAPLPGRTAGVPASAAAQSRAAEAAAGPVSQPVDAFLRAEVHRQVMEAALSRMSIVLRDGVAQARIQLDPPSLGRMHMEIRMQDGAMHARATVETGWARDAVMSGLRELRESLQRQGVSLENFSVDVRANLNASHFGQDRAANQGGDGAYYLEAVPEEESGAYAPAQGPAFAGSSASGDRSINIFA